MLLSSLIMKTLPRRLIVALGFLLSLCNLAYAQINISGDVRVRPRWDINDRTGAGQNLSRDVYIMYRARVAMQADIGDGWTFNSLFGHNGVGEYAGKFAKGELPDILGVEQSNISNDAARRATVDFMLLNIAYKHEIGGFRVGLMSVGAVGNPFYDLHYYPSRMVDIPYFIFNNDGIYGARGYKNYNDGNTVLTGAFYVDDDRGGFLKSAEGELLQDANDKYSVEMGLTHKTGAIQWQVQSLLTLAADSLAKPMTFSLRSSGWKVGKTALSGQLMYSRQGVQDPVCEQGHFGIPLNRYDAWFVRLTAIRNFGEDRLRLWVDAANRHDQLATGNVNRQFTHIWCEYNIQLAKTDKGRVVLSPRFRQQLHAQDSDQLQLRHKLEIDLDLFF